MEQIIKPDILNVTVNKENEKSGGMTMDKGKETVNVTKTDKEKQQGFTVERASDIQKSEDTQQEYVIDGLLPPGVTLLAAPRKQCKSWFALDVALCIARGEEFWGRKTKQGKVLMFALEDTRARMRERMNKQLDYDDAPDDLLITYKIDCSRSEFNEYLDDYLSKNSGIELVIIDVLQKIRSDKKTNQTEYGHDYQDIGELKRIADEHDIPFLVITHTKKAQDKRDRLNDISGGVGVTGAADTILMICGDRDINKEKTLYITGRDVPEEELKIKFDTNCCKWKYIGPKEEFNIGNDKEVYSSSPIVKTVKALIEKDGCSWCGTCQELLECGLSEMGEPIAKSESALARKLNKFDELFLKDSIQHTRPDPNGGIAGRKHSFVRLDKMQPVPKCNESASKTETVAYTDLADAVDISNMFLMEDE